MSNVTKFPQIKRGRPKSPIPRNIDPETIAKQVHEIDPADTETVRQSVNIPGWLYELIDKSTPRKVKVTGVLLAGLSQMGFPVTQEQLEELIETGDFDKGENDE